MKYKYIEIITTINSIEKARTLADIIVEKRFAACAQIEGPVESIYWWKDKKETVREWRIVFKTKAGFYKKLEEEIIKYHPYEVPEIISIPIENGSSKYLNWISEETGKD